MAIKRVSPTEAKALQDQGYVYLDVRSVPEYEQGHPTGADNAPLMHAGSGGMAPNPEFLAVVQAAYAKDAKLVVGCKSGGRSQRAAMMMEAAGFSSLVEMRGGYSGETDGSGRIAERGWADVGLPVTQAATVGGSWAELKQRK